jgi:hypothetical protein
LVADWLQRDQPARDYEQGMIMRDRQKGLATTYQLVPECDGISEAWAVLATDDGCAPRYVSRLITRAQAEMMIERIEAMVAREKVNYQASEPSTKL